MEGVSVTLDEVLLVFITLMLSTPPQWHQDITVMVGSTHEQLQLWLAQGSLAWKGFYLWREGVQGIEGVPWWFPSAPQSLLFRAATPAWPLPHGFGASPCSDAGCSDSFCPLQGSFSNLCLLPCRAALLPLSVSCLTVLSELEWCPAWWKCTFCKALFLLTKLCQCKSVQDLDQCCCSQCSDLWPAYVWLIAWLLMQERSGMMGATFIVL